MGCLIIGFAYGLGILKGENDFQANVRGTQILQMASGGATSNPVELNPAVNSADVTS